MAGPSQSSGVVTQPKAMSSRLSNMKFMQRGAYDDARKASADGSNPPSAKRARLSYGGSVSQPDTPSKTHEQELKPLGFSGAETMWILDTGLTDDNDNDLTEDSLDDDVLPWEVENVASGRMTFGSSKTKPKVSTTPSTDKKRKNNFPERQDGNELGDIKADVKIRARLSSNPRSK